MKTLIAILLVLLAVCSLQAAISEAVPAGEARILSVTSDGTLPLTYQWRKDGVNITGATGQTYTITSFSSATAGAYDVTVSNSAGSVISDKATLTLAIAKPTTATVTVSRAGT